MIDNLDILQAFMSDLKDITDLPEVVFSNRPTDKASIMVKINNPEAEFISKSGNAKVLTGQINIHISHKRGTYQTEMFRMAKQLTSIYTRDKTFGNENFKVKLTAVNTSSVYSSESHENVNVILSYITFNV